MRTPLNEWNPFDYLIERESSAGRHSYSVFTQFNRVSLWSEYVWSRTIHRGYARGGCRCGKRLIQAESAVVIRMDTRLDLNSAGRTGWTGLQPYLCRSVSGCLRRSKRAFVDLI